MDRLLFSEEPQQKVVFVYPLSSTQCMLYVGHIRVLCDVGRELTIGSIPLPFSITWHYLRTQLSLYDMMTEGMNE